MTDLAKDANSTAAEELSKPTTIGVEAYISEDYARAERDRLWRKVWQQVGRVEELPEVGSYLTYDILDDSILGARPQDRTFPLRLFFSELGTLLAHDGAHEEHGPKPINWFDFDNSGLATLNDNAYDGTEARRAPGRDARGCPIGGEESDYGDLLGPVSEYLRGVDARLAGR